MANSVAGKQRLLLVLMIIAAALVAVRSARRRDAAPRAFPPPVPRARVGEPVPTQPITPAEPPARPPAESDEQPESVVASVAGAEPVEPESVVAPVVEAESAEPEPIAESPGGEPAPTPGPFPGSVLALPDGSAPASEFVVKAKISSKRCHGPTSPYYGRTRADVWFRTEREAIAAGFRPWTPKGA